MRTVPESKRERVKAGVGKREWQNQKAEAVKKGNRKLSHRPGQDGQLSSQLLRQKLGKVGARLTPAYSRRQIKTVLPAIRD
jgi:hypothetical protein